MPESLSDSLRIRFGFESFRPGQLDRDLGSFAPFDEPTKPKQPALW